jgi:hypothetical protein
MQRIILALFLLASLLAPASAQAPAAPPAAFVTAQGDRLMLNGALFEVKGVNYFPRDFAFTSLTDWDWSAVGQELSLAESIHSNTVRVPIHYPYSTGNPGRQKDILTTDTVLPAYLQALDRFLALADQHHLKAIFELNDGVWPELWNPQNIRVEQAYLSSLVPHFAADPRLAAWDIAPNIDAEMLLPAPDGSFGALAWSTRDNLVAFVRNVSSYVRQLDPNHLLGAGVTWPSTAVLLQDYTDIIFPQFFGQDYPALLTGPSAGSAEDYADWSAILTRPDAVFAGLQGKIGSIQSQLKRPMPVVLSAFGFSTYQPAGSTPAQQQVVIQAVSRLALVQSRASGVQPRLAGALASTLIDFTWPPRVSTDLPTANTPEFNPELNFGLFGTDYKPKPAADAISSYFNPAQALTLQPVLGQSPAGEESLTVTGSFPIPISDGAVTVQVSSTLDNWKDAASAVPEGGSFSAAVPLTRGQSGFVRAVWAGDGIYLPVTSNSQPFHFDLLKSSLTLSSLPDTILQDTDLTIFGRMLPAESGLTLSLTLTAPGGTTQSQPVITTSGGAFSATFRPAQAGRWVISFRWEGDADYGTLEQSASFNVAQPALDCTISSASASPGDQVVLSGFLTPALKDVPISLTLNLPDGTIQDDTVQTAADGSFTYTVVPEAAGNWTISAEAPGSFSTFSSSCSGLAFTVQTSILPYLYIGLVLVGIVVVGTLAGYIVAVRRKKRNSL